MSADDDFLNQMSQTIPTQSSPQSDDDFLNQMNQTLPKSTSTGIPTLGPALNISQSNVPINNNSLYTNSSTTSTPTYTQPTAGTITNSANVGPIGTQTNPGTQTLDSPALRFEANLSNNPYQAVDFLNSKNIPNTKFSLDPNKEVIYSQDNGNTWNRFQTTLPNEFNWNNIISSITQKEPEITEGIGTGVGAALGTTLGPLGSMGVAGIGGGLTNAGNQLLGSTLGVSPINGNYAQAAKQIGTHAALDAAGEGIGKMVIGPIADSLLNVGLDQTGQAGSILSPRQLSPSERFGGLGSLVQKLSQGSIADEAMRSANQDYTSGILKGLDKNIFQDTNGLSSIPDNLKPPVGASLSQINPALKQSILIDNDMINDRLDNVSQTDLDDPNMSQEMDSLNQAKSILDPVVQGIKAGKDFSGMKTGQVVGSQGPLVDLMKQGNAIGSNGNISNTLNNYQRYLAAELNQKVLPAVPGEINWGALNSESTNPMGINYIQDVLQPNRANEPSSSLINQLESIKQIGSDPQLFPKAQGNYRPDLLDKIDIVGPLLKGLGHTIDLFRTGALQPAYDPYGALGRAAAIGTTSNQNKQ